MLGLTPQICTPQPFVYQYRPATDPSPPATKGGLPNPALFGPRMIGGGLGGVRAGSGGGFILPVAGTCAGGGSPLLRGGKEKTFYQVDSHCETSFAKRQRRQAVLAAGHAMDASRLRKGVAHGLQHLRGGSGRAETPGMGCGEQKIGGGVCIRYGAPGASF